jgi:hypothetical protein
LIGYDCPGDEPTQPFSVAINAFALQKAILFARTGTYNIQVSSVDPATPVSFQMDAQPFDVTRQTETAIISAATGRFPDILKVVTNPTSVAPTQWNQNPVKIVISQITSDQGEYTGNSAVLYGYYLQPFGQQLQYYLNTQQSTQDFRLGTCGISIAIDEAHSLITAG